MGNTANKQSIHPLGLIPANEQLQSQRDEQDYRDLHRLLSMSTRRLFGGVPCFVLHDRCNQHKDNPYSQVYSTNGKHVWQDEPVTQWGTLSGRLEYFGGDGDSAGAIEHAKRTVFARLDDTLTHGRGIVTFLGSTVLPVTDVAWIVASYSAEVVPVNYTIEGPVCLARHNGRS